MGWAGRLFGPIVFGIGCLIGVVGPLLAQGSPTPVPTPAIVPQEVRVPFAGQSLVVLVYKPEGPGPFPVVVFSHGRAPKVEDRAKPIVALNGHVAYWQRKGLALIAPVRLGYGQTGGPDVEDNGLRRQNGQITREPNYTTTVTKAAESDLAAINWLRTQTWADARHLILEGQSVGGFATVKLGSLNLPGVIACINFAGGSGGNPDETPGQSARPELLTALYRDFGKVTKVPSIWFYAANDLYWGPDVPAEWYAAFAEGGGPSQFVHTPAIEGHDGHQLLNYGGRLWSRPLDAFIATLNLH